MRIAATRRSRSRPPSHSSASVERELPEGRSMMRNETVALNRGSNAERGVGGVSERTRPLVIGCGALAHELVELTRRAGLPAMDLTCLPADLHNRPERIPSAVAARIRRARADGYAQ